MTHRLEVLADEIVRLQAELDREIEHRRRSFGVVLKGRLAEFEHGLVAEHRKLRTGLAAFMRRASPATILTAPVIYSMIVPLVLLDLWMSLYQAICFRVYAIPRVRRSDYVALDRGRLAYLNGIEALNCMYCGYGNGVIAYAREIASRTEQYWCPIKHAIGISSPHERYLSFLEYGDAEGYRTRLDAFRSALRQHDGAAEPEPDPLREIA